MMEPPRSVKFDDVYFSAHDGAAETKHVFFDGNNLPQRWQGGEGFTVAETGFGTGLNFLLTWKLFDETAPNGAMLDYISIEKYPLLVDEIRNGLSPWAGELNPYLEKMLAQYPIRVPGFHRIVFDGRVVLTLIFDDVNAALPEISGNVDAWFLDGFTPSKNPDMWSERVFGEMARLSHEGTTFATFTAAGFVKRGLQAVGFDVQKTKGFAHKRDMLCGVFKSEKKYERPSYKKSILIHGAGLAGCACAYVFKQYGFDVAIYDPNGLASGASGNELGLINPRFTAHRNEISDFYTAGFAQTVRTFSMMDDVDYLQCGSIHLVNDEDKQKRFNQTIENWAWHHDHMQYLSPQAASEVSGVPISHEALYLPQSAQINPAKLCEFYTKDVEFVDSPDGKHDVHILAMGAGSVGDGRVSGLPIHTVRGQITKIKSNKKSKAIKTNICYGGYVSAPRDGYHIVGSTFQKWLVDTSIIEQDDEDNLSKLSTQIADLSDFEVVGGCASLRTASKDRFPIIGKISDSVYISTAHGSHGIVSSLVGAHFLADMIRNGALSLGASSVNALSPARFQAKKN